MAGAFFSGLDLPEEAAFDIPLVTIRGYGSVTVENYRRILSFSETETEILTAEGRLSVRGQGLFLEFLRKDALRIRGRISELSIK